MKFNVYQNLTQFMTEVEAESEKEAIKKAQELPSEEWQEYEPVQENIFYDALSQEPEKVSKEEVLILGDNNYWYSTLCTFGDQPVKEEDIEEEIKAIKKEIIQCGEMNQESIQENLFVYKAKEIKRVNLKNNYEDNKKTRL